MKALRLLLTYLGMFAVVLGGVLLVDRLSRPEVRPWHDLAPGLPTAAATVVLGSPADRAGLSLQVVKTEFLTARRCRHGAPQLEGTGATVIGFFARHLGVDQHPQRAGRLPNRRTATYRRFSAGRNEAAAGDVAPILPGDVTRLGATPLENVTLAPGDEVQGAVDFVVDGSEQGLNLLVVPVSGAGAFGALGLAPVAPD